MEVVDFLLEAEKSRTEINSRSDNNGEKNMVFDSSIKEM
jgi:hypothetical protein